MTKARQAVPLLFLLALGLAMCTAGAAPYHIGVNTGWAPNLDRATWLTWAFDAGADMPRVGMRLDLADGDGLAHPDEAVIRFCSAGRHPLGFLFNRSVTHALTDGTEVTGCKVPRGLWEPVFDNASDAPTQGAAINPANEWARFVARIVERYDADGTDDAPGSPRLDYYSLWNEPDWVQWPARPTNPADRTMRNWFGADVHDLARLVFVSARAADHADPTARLGIQVCFPETLGFLLDDADHPAAPSLDFVDFHAYAGPGSDLLIEAEAGLLGILRQMRDEYDKRGLRQPDFLCSECGHPGDDLRGVAASEAVQRAAAAKVHIVGAAEGLIAVCWYGLFDPCWQNMGLVGDVRRLPADGRGAWFKDAFYALRTLAELLGGLADGSLAYERRLDVGPGARAHLFRRPDDRRVWVAWAHDPRGEPTLRATVRLNLPEASLARYHWDYCLTGGPVATIHGPGGELALELGPDPVYLVEYAGAPPTMSPLTRPPRPPGPPWQVEAEAFHPDNPPALAADGDTDTEWVGGWGRETVWWAITFDEPRTVSRVRVKASPTARSPWVVQCSEDDGRTWQDLSAPCSSSDWSLRAFPLTRTVTCRHFRLLFTLPDRQTNVGLFEVVFE